MQANFLEMLRFLQNAYGSQISDLTPQGEEAIRIWLHGTVDVGYLKSRVSELGWFVATSDRSVVLEPRYTSSYPSDKGGPLLHVSATSNRVHRARRTWAFDRRPDGDESVVSTESVLRR
jgi:hypothetical protein